MSVVLRDLVERSAMVAGFGGVGVSLLVGDELAVATASDESIVAVERVQEAARRGPCIDAQRSGEPVAVTDLADFAERWPEVAAAAAEVGVHAAAAIPMRLDGEAVGVLDLYDTEAREWSENDLRAARWLADMVTAHVVATSRLQRAENLAAQLQHALDSRVIVEQAKGMLAADGLISVDESFELLRRHARNHHASIDEVAATVVKDGLRFEQPRSLHPRRPPGAERRPGVERARSTTGGRRRRAADGSRGVDWAVLSAAMSELGTAADAATVGAVIVDSCHRALGATAAGVWLGDPGGADRQLIGSHGRVPDTAELSAPVRRRGSLRCSRDPEGAPTCAMTSVVPGDHLVATFWARFAADDHLGPVRFGALDVLIAAGAAALRCSQSVEHARGAGLLLQRHLLPEIHPGNTGEAAARYAAAGDGSRVGGDWFDIVHTSDARTVLVLGDVAGHGIEAAVEMTALRTALYSHLLDGLPATIAMARLNDLAVDRHGFATCCCVEIGPQGAMVTSAGHPPPLVVGPDNQPAVCTVRPGPILGAVAHANYSAHRLELEPGDTIVLYSDGLIERPGTIITDEIERLRRAAADIGTNDPDEIADHLLGLAGPQHRLRDDVALLAFRPAPHPVDLTIRPIPVRVDHQNCVIAAIRPRTPSDSAKQSASSSAPPGMCDRVSIAQQVHDP